jgi:hypothetical protein
MKPRQVWIKVVVPEGSVSGNVLRELAKQARAEHFSNDFLDNADVDHNVLMDPIEVWIVDPDVIDATYNPKTTLDTVTLKDVIKLHTETVTLILKTDDVGMILRALVVYNNVLSSNSMEHVDLLNLRKRLLAVKQEAKATLSRE